MLASSSEDGGGEAVLKAARRIVITGKVCKLGKNIEYIVRGKEGTASELYV